LGNEKENAGQEEFQIKESGREEGIAFIVRIGSSKRGCEG